MRTAKGGRGIRAEAWGFNLAETYPNQGLIIPVAWRERSKQRSVPQGSESYRGKEPTREMLLFGADRANNDGMRLWRCPRSRKPEGACPRWRVLDNRVDHRIDRNRNVYCFLVDLFPQRQPAETVVTLSSSGVASLSSHLPYQHLPGTCGPPDPCVGRAAASRLAHADASRGCTSARARSQTEDPLCHDGETVRFVVWASDAATACRVPQPGARRGGTLPP